MGRSGRMFQEWGEGISNDRNPGTRWGRWREGGSRGRAAEVSRGCQAGATSGQRQAHGLDLTFQTRLLALPYQQNIFNIPLIHVYSFIY